VTQITDHLASIRRRIESVLARSDRKATAVTIVAVSKRQTADAIADAAAAGLTQFGENYLQEGLEKITAVANPAIDWHFVGRVQSNKTRSIAKSFSWVQTIDQKRIAERLNAQRPDHLDPLNVLVQMNLDQEPQKAGIGTDELLPLAEHISRLSRLHLRGVMAMPPADQSPSEKRASFLALAAEAGRLKSHGFDIDTISMGMSSDFELAIECGSNCVRLGTAIFGPRPTIPA